MRKKVLNLVSLLGLALAVALFVPQRAAADEDDPPSRVARLSYTHGNVSFEPAGTDDWVTAVVNRPMTSGDKLWSDNGGRAELHLGSAAVRLSSNTGFSFLNLSLIFGFGASIRMKLSKSIRPTWLSRSFARAITRST